MQNFFQDGVMMPLILKVLFVIIIYMTIWFFIALAKKRNDVADVAWGPGFILTAFISLLMTGSFSDRALITSAMVILWGSRLAVHIVIEAIAIRHAATLAFLPQISMIS